MDNKALTFKPAPSWNLIKGNNLNDSLNQSLQDEAASQKNSGWITQILETTIGPVPVVSTELSWSDRIGGYKVRWGWNRMDYRVKPGLYAVGTPDILSRVLVTSNYKLTFDSLRRELPGLNVWILVIDTKGVNVWCAAGKGTFGTRELIHRIFTVKLDKLVGHKQLILPQLGAVGVEAHKVTAATKFHIKYGPVYARDIKKYIDNSLIKKDAMRDIHFTLYDRLVLIPIELTSAFVYLVIIAAVGTGFNILKHRQLSAESLIEALVYMGSIFTGAVLFPLLLPWIPCRAFSVKGAFIGMIWAVAGSIILSSSVLGTLGNILLLTPITAYLALNFTGATAYTSQAGTFRETKASLPVMVLSALTGLILTIINNVSQFLKAGG